MLKQRFLKFALPLILAVTIPVIAEHVLHNTGRDGGIDDTMPVAEEAPLRAPSGAADTGVVASAATDPEPEDAGLGAATLRIDARPFMLPDDTLNVTAKLDGADRGKRCEITWYVDDEAVSSASFLTGGYIPGFDFCFDFGPKVQNSMDIVLKAEVRHIPAGTGEEQILSAGYPVRLKNYSRAEWVGILAPEVLEKVTAGYKGDNTLEWAEQNDLEDYEKEVWVNAKGFTSPTEYLVWLNLAHQRVNIFKDADGYWELIRSCIAGTGRPGMGTPPGVWYITGRQTDGWHFTTYTVAPVVNFISGTDYAFHSRLFMPDSDELFDDRIGFPVSHGCVRMYDKDIWFMHDNIFYPTTVVVH